MAQGKMSALSFLSSVAAIAWATVSVAVVSVDVQAQQIAPWPAKPIRIIVPAAVGGPTDIVARLLANELSPTLGQSVWVENRVGAGHMIGTAAAATAEPDGHTLAVVSTPHVVNPWLRKKMPYETKDLRPVSWLTSSPLVLVVPASLPANTLAELVALAKSKPGELNMASPGTATGPHLAGELFRLAAGIKVQHVAYRGGPDATTAMLRGDSHLYFETPSVAVSNVQTGTLRALGITLPTRSASIPNVPTIAEAGYAGYEFDSWTGLVAPLGVNSDIVARLEKEVLQAMAKPETSRRLTETGFVPVGASAKAFGDLIAKDLAKWESVVKAAGLTAE